VEEVNRMLLNYHMCQFSNLVFMAKKPNLEKRVFTYQRLE